MPTELWKYMNYKTPIKFFVNTYIREYDLSKANINALLYTGRITREEYSNYLTMDKRERETRIGLWIRKDQSVWRDIQKGIIEAKRRLSFANEIEDYDIVSIKNDAMFIVGRELSQRFFDPFEFKVKNTYNVFMQLADLEVYYGDTINPADGTIETTIDVKGIPDETLALHQGGMLDLICDVCYKLQREDIRDTAKWLSDIYQSYLLRKLPLQFYRNFDSTSGFILNTFIRSVSLSEIDETMVNAVDINRNLLVLREIMSIITNIYNRTIR